MELLLDTLQINAPIFQLHGPQQTTLTAYFSMTYIPIGSQWLRFVLVLNHFSYGVPFLWYLHVLFVCFFCLILRGVRTYRQCAGSRSRGPYELVYCLYVTSKRCGCTIETFLYKIEFYMLFALCLCSVGFIIPILFCFQDVLNSLKYSFWARFNDGSA